MRYSVENVTGCCQCIIGASLGVGTADGIGAAELGIGAADGSVTSMQAELGREIDLAEVKAVLAAEFGKLLPEFLAADGTDKHG